MVTANKNKLNKSLCEILLTERMIFILFKKIMAVAAACFITTVSAAGYFDSESLISNNVIPQAISADAATNVTKPQIKLVVAYSDRIYVSLSNVNNYKPATTFNVYVNNVLAKKNVTLNSIKSNSNYITITNDGKLNLKPNTSYSIKVSATYNNRTSSYSSVLNTKTSKTGYFNLKKSTQLYQINGSKVTKNTKLTSSIVVVGTVTNEKGTAINGKSAANYKAQYIKVTQGKYKGKYIKISDNTANRITEQTYKRRIVSDYAASMNGGRYVYGGSKYRATDCSGLVMLSYAQIGVSLPHSARGQWSKGKAVNRSNMQAGDIIVMNGGSHVGMYIGNNQFVHAMNSRDGIKIQSTSNLKYYTVNSIRRII